LRYAHGALGADERESFEHHRSLGGKPPRDAARRDVADRDLAGLGDENLRFGAAKLLTYRGDLKDSVVENEGAVDGLRNRACGIGLLVQMQRAVQAAVEIREHAAEEQRIERRRAKIVSF